MASYTPNYNLERPAQDDFYDVDKFNANATKIDIAMKQNADAVESATDLAGAHAARHATNGADPLTPAQIGAAPAAVSRNVTLTSTAWSGSGPYTQSVAWTGATALSLFFYDIIDAPSEDQLDAYEDARITCTPGVNIVTVRVNGDKPAINIPFVLVKMG
ncbi:hypothetical protein LJC27_01780 [Christensenellaceae bacterium OttesenSCG-928-M15]|nr:hypothetical protein [Christensenellaceae bacterium OttesenSCG-928-M15]